MTIRQKMHLSGPASKYLLFSFVIISVFTISFLFYTRTSPSIDYTSSLQESYSKYTYNSKHYKIAGTDFTFINLYHFDIVIVIADMDTNSRMKNKSGTYRSELLIGELTRLANDSYTIEWGEPV